MAGNIDDKTLQNLNKRIQDLDRMLKQAADSSWLLGKNIGSIAKNLDLSGAVKSIDEIKKHAEDTAKSLSNSLKGAPKSIKTEMKALKQQYSELVKYIEKTKGKTFIKGLSSSATNIANASAPLAANANVKASKNTEKEKDNVKQLIAEYRELERERRRLLKVAEQDARWQEQQRRNQQAIYDANGKAIEQQRRLSAQIDEIRRKRDALGSKQGNLTYMSMAEGKYANYYDKRIEELRRLQNDIEKQFSGSKKAGERVFETEKIRRDAEQLAKSERQASVEREKALQRQINLETKANQIRRDYNKTKGELRFFSPRSEEYQKGQQVLQRYRQELHNIYQEQKKIDNEYKGSRAAAYNQKRLDGLRQEYEQLRRNGRQIKKNNDTLGTMIPNLQRLASAFGLAFSVQGLAQFGKKLIETRGQFEMQFVAMKQIIGDLDQATRIWNKTLALALKSPFTAMQLTTYTKQLAAYRIENDKLYDTTKRLADVSAGLGVDMGRLILAYGQVKTANFLRASEVRQFTEAGVNIYKELSDYFSEMQGRAVSTAEVVDMVQKRMVSFADVEEIFKRMTDEGGQFYDMQRIQSDTVRGQIMKLKDAYDQMLNTIGEGNQGTIRNMVAALLSMVRNWRDAWYVIEKSAWAIGTYVIALKLLGVEWKKAGWQAIFFNQQLRIGNLDLKSYWATTKILTADLKAFPRFFQRAGAAAKVFGSVLKSLRAVWVIAAIEGIVLLAEKMTEAQRHAKRLKKDLENIRSTESNRAFEEESSYMRLVSKYERANEGSKERAEIISELNSKYGKYLNFVVEESTSVEKLANAYNDVSKGAREAARARAEEAVRERIEQENIEKETKAREKARKSLKFKSGNFFADNLTIGAKEQTKDWNRESGFSGKLRFTESEIDQAFAYLESRVAVRWEELKNMSQEEKESYVREVFAKYFNVEPEDIANISSAIDSLDLLIKKYQQLGDSNEKMREKLAGQGLAEGVIKSILDVENQYNDAIRNLYKAGRGEGINFGQLIAPGNISERDAALEFIKERLNLEKNELQIDIKVNAGALSSEEAKKIKASAKSVGDEYANALNREIEKIILDKNGVTKTLDEIWDGLKQGKQLTEDEANAIGQINTLRIRESQIVNGMEGYEKSLKASLDTQLSVIDEINNKRGKGLDNEENLNNLLDKALVKYRNIYNWMKKMGLDVDARYDAGQQVGDKRLAEIRKQYIAKFGENMETLGENFVGEKATQGLQETADAYHNAAEDLKKRLKNQENAVEKDAKQIQETKDQIERLEWLATAHGYTSDKKTGSGSKDTIQQMVDLIKRMNDEYVKLKTNAYGAAKSQYKVRESFKQSVQQILGPAGVGIDYDFMTKGGMVDAMQKVVAYAQKLYKASKLTKEQYENALKTLDTWRADMEIAVEVHKREDFDRKMEELFKDYELSVEMKELKIPENVAESMFGFTYKTLGDLQAEMNKFYEEQQNNGLLDTKAWEAYKKYADKIDAEIMKERKERAKQYSKFMEKEISDRAKLEKEYYDNIAMISSESAFTDKQKSNIIQQVTDDFQKALAKLDWETFKSSDFYVEMMDDLTNMPVKYMEVMLKEVNKVIENADILSPRALKEALRARREVREAILSEASLSGIFRETIGAFRTYRANGYTGDEANQEAERRLGMTPGATTVAGLVKERKLLREAVSIRSEYIAQKEEEIKIADEQIARLQSYWEAYNKFQEQKKNFNNGTILGPEGEIYTPTSIGVGEARSALNAIQAQIDEEEGKNIKLTGEELDNHIATVEVLTQKKEEYEKILHILEEFIAAQNKLASTEGRLTSTDRDESGNVLQVSPLQAERNKLQLSKDTLMRAQEGDKEALKNLKRFTDAWNELSNNVNNAKEKLKSLGSATYDMLESLGMETNLVTDAWKNFADTLMDTITGALTMIPQLVAGFVSAGVSINAAMGIVGLIAEAIQLVITLITALAKLEDSYHLQAIEDSKKRVDELSKSFDKLNDVIDKTLSSAEYFTVYVGEVENLNEQLAEANLQLQEAAQIKDKSDREEATKNAKDNIDEIQKQLEDAANDLQDTFGGIARKDFRSWAEEFVDAWTDAFLETGDGYDALMDTFEDKLLETFKKQALMRGLAKIMEPLENAINAYVGDDAIINDAELDDIRRRWEIAARNSDEYMRRMAEIWDLGATGQLSGLSAGISGMTEETAEVLEGYWNSVRMYTAETNQNVAIIADAFSNPDSTNPMLGQLRLIAEQATQIRTLLDSVTKSAGHPRGGAGIKVFMS